MFFTAPPKEQKDLNDWLKMGMDGGDFLDVVMRAQPIRTTKLSMRGVSVMWMPLATSRECSASKSSV